MVIDADILIDHFHDHKAATAFIRDTLLTGRESHELEKVYRGN